MILSCDDKYCYQVMPRYMLIQLQQYLRLQHVCIIVRPCIMSPIARPPAQSVNYTYGVILRSARCQ